MDNLTLMKMFLVMGDKTQQTLKEKIAYKERIIFATQGIIKPRNWEELSDEEKLNRLTKLQKV